MVAILKQFLFADEQSLGQQHGSSKAQKEVGHFLRSSIQEIIERDFCSNSSYVHVLDGNPIAKDWNDDCCDNSSEMHC